MSGTPAAYELVVHPRMSILPSPTTHAAAAPLLAELVERAIAEGPPQAAFIGRRRTLGGMLRAIAASIGSACGWVFGVLSLVIVLAVVAVVPVLQLISLGYLLEVAGSVMRSGRLRDGFPGVRPAARLGGIALGASLCMLPLWWLSEMATAAKIIDPASPAARGWTAALWIAAALVGLHMLGACLRGGRFRQFLWPRPFKLLAALLRPATYGEARDAVCDFFIALRLPHYFWLGLRGLVSGIIWLALPVLLLSAGRQAPLLGFIGAALLMWVLLYLPFLQARFAAENRFKAMFELRPIRELFRRAPWAFWCALLVTLAFALPLYLLKIELIPREAAWLPSLVFVVFIWPARLLTGWACGYAAGRAHPRHWLSRTAARLAMLPLVLIFVFLLFFTQASSWYGSWSLLEQHAFLLPVPFWGF